MVKKQKKEFTFLLKIDPLQTWIRKEEIGDGSFGKVYLVDKKDGTQSAAMKVCPIESEIDMEDMAQEAHILLTCECPYILKSYGAYFFEQKIHMILEFCDGGSIDDILIEMESGIFEPFIEAIMYQMFVALNYCHKKGIVHRDIKAGNMLLTCNGLMKLADFGVSGVNTHSGQKRHTYIGTPYWMAPEVIMTETNPDKYYDEKCDIWSMGITCIELAETAPPHHEEHPMCVIHKIRNSVPPTLTERDKWSPQFNDFISKCLVYDYNNRPSCEQLLKHKFLQISDENSRVVLKSFYMSYKNAKVDIYDQEINSDLEDVTGTLSETNIDTNVPSLSSHQKKLSQASTPTEEIKLNLKTVRKTFKFQFDGKEETRTTVNLFDGNESAKSQKVEKNRCNEIKEMHRMLRLENRELDKKKDANSVKTEELEAKQQSDKQKIIDKNKLEYDAFVSFVSKEVSKKKSALVESQKKEYKKLRSEMEKELKSTRGGKKPIKDPNSEAYKEVSTKYCEKFKSFVASQTTELLTFSTDLVKKKFEKRKKIEADLWAFEGRQLQEFCDSQINMERDISLLTYFQIVRKFKKEIFFLKERHVLETDQTKKKHIVAIREFPKAFKNQLKQKLDTKKKEYRKSAKKGITLQNLSEKDYLKIIYDEEINKKDTMYTEMITEQKKELDELSKKAEEEIAKISQFKLNKQKGVFENALARESRRQKELDEQLRSWLSELQSRKYSIIEELEKELEECSKFQMKEIADWS